MFLSDELKEMGSPKSGMISYAIRSSSAQDKADGVSVVFCSSVDFVSFRSVFCVSSTFRRGWSGSLYFPEVEPGRSRAKSARVQEGESFS